MCKKLIVLALSLCVISSAGASTIVWDFENGNDHRFTLWSAYYAWPTDDDPNTAGDEALTGAGGAVSLPDFGVAWTVGPPTQFDGQKPAADVANARVDADGLLDYSLGTERIATESGTLNTFNLNQHGDYIHTQENDQIATSMAVLLDEGSVLKVWSWGGGSNSHAPEYDPDPIQMYTNGSSGIAVLSAEEDDLYAILATIHTQGKSTLTEDTLDLSAFAGKQVYIEVVDAFEGGWGWLAVDKIQITNAIVPLVIWDFENGEDHDFVLSTVKPATPAPDDPNTAGDEALTGGWEPGNPENLPEAGNTWTIGAPEDFDGLYAGADPGRREDEEGKLLYSLGKQRIISGHGSLNTYCLNFHGDYVHTPQNDQIATSPSVLLLDNAVLTIWSSGGGSNSIPPELDPDPNEGYVDNSGGLVVLSADDGSILTTLWLQQKGLDADEAGNPDSVVGFDELDLSAFAGQTVIFEVVDAYEGGWGWISVDEIQISNARVLGIEWDFENGNDHGFTLSCINPATPAADDPATAGDEALTGGWDPNNPNNLPQAGMVWEIGTPDMSDGLLPGADPDHARTDANGLLDYAGGTDRFLNHDHGFLNTFSLNYHGDYVHDQENDQIATSPTVMLYEGAMLTAITVAGGADTEPILDEPGKGYTDGSGGIAVRSAADGTILASMVAQSGNEEEPFTLDLSAFAGQEVYIEVVDAHEGGWGWIAVDSIVITNAL